jgi:hypothetical protein
MYTIPVRMDFKDKDTRINAETSLRKICKLSCATPYPKKLRALLNELVKEGKKKHPNCFIRTRVNVDKLTVDAQAKMDSGWIDLNLTRDIPLNILDNNPFVNEQVPELAPASQAEEMEETEDEEPNLS